MIKSKPTDGETLLHHNHNQSWHDTNMFQLYLIFDWLWYRLGALILPLGIPQLPT